MNKLSWDLIQKQSDLILSDGLFKLKSESTLSHSQVEEKGFGNYLITLDNIPFYIGEAKELKKRLNQQFKESTSTFYKNYLRQIETNKQSRLFPIDRFKVQVMTTKIGRKEIEEFGIVNLPTKLNKFQLDKRIKHVIKDHKGIWNMLQQNYNTILSEGESIVLETRFTKWFDTSIDSTPGLYLVKDQKGNLIYIGESSNVGERIKTHTSQTYFSALRRHIGTEILGYTLKERNGKKKYFTATEDNFVTEFLKTCKSSISVINFGRYELEEYMIKKHRPLLNIKDNKD